MKNGFKERYKDYRILLWYDRWVITDKHGTTVAEIPTWRSPYELIDSFVALADKEERK